MNSVYIPTPFLMLSDASLAQNIRQQVTAPPSPERLPWKMLPELDAKAIAYKNRIEKLRQERDRNLAEAERLAAQNRNSAFAKSGTYKLPGHHEDRGKLDGAINFSVGSNKAFLGSVDRGSGAESKSSESEGGAFDFSSFSSSHRRRSGSSETGKRRHSVDSNFIAGNLQIDIFNHDK